MNELLRKVHLTRLLNYMRLLFPNEYNFYPKTWFLPEQNQQFKDDVRYIHQLDKKQNRSLTTFIVKPSGKRKEYDLLPRYRLLGFQMVHKVKVSISFEIHRISFSPIVHMSFKVSPMR